VDSERRPLVVRAGRLTTSAVLLLTGAALLYQNIQQVWIWPSLWRYWPAALLLFGAEILYYTYRRAPVQVRVDGLAALLLAAVLLVGAGVQGYHSWPWPQGLPFVGRSHQGGPYHHTRTLEIHRDDLAGIELLDLRNLSGQIDIRGSTGDSLHIVATMTGFGGTEESARAHAERTDLLQESRGQALVVRASDLDRTNGSVKVRVDYQVTLPHALRVETSSVSGRVTLAGTEAPAELTTVSGGIRVDNHRGPLSLTSVSGAMEVRGGLGSLHAASTSGTISVELDELAGDCRCKTVSGTVRVALPEDASFQLQAKSISGTMQAEVAGVSVSERALTASVNGGEHLVKVDTVSGDVHIELKE